VGRLELSVRLVLLPLDVEQQRIESPECRIPWVQVHGAASRLKSALKLTVEEKSMGETILDLSILGPVPRDILTQRNSRTRTSLSKLSLCQGIKQLKLMRLPPQGFSEQPFAFGCIAGPDKEHPLPCQF
jgi:hypothetical protein